MPITAAAQRKRRKQLQAAGKCIDCGAPGRGHARCKRCRDLQLGRKAGTYTQSEWEGLLAQVEGLQYRVRELEHFEMVFSDNAALLEQLSQAHADTGNLRADLARLQGVEIVNGLCALPPGRDGVEYDARGRGQVKGGPYHVA